MKLVVIEGIGKKETIEKYLGSGYRVFATKGHIVDLKEKSLAINVKNNFAPEYVIMEDKKDIAKKLKEAAGKADKVLLATDPDREGEAISWHVANLLGIELESPVRIEFNEISKKAITAALEKPRAIKTSLVEAQQARRVLDRLVGYKLSPLLCRKIQNRLSAGRVQSVTLRLVVEREREIRNFKPEEYWPFFSVLKKGEEGDKFRASLQLKDNKKYKITSEDEVNAVKAELDGAAYRVSNVKKSVTRSKPSAPFITSTMQQDALNKLGMTLKQTQSAAQMLYEGVDIPGEGKVALVTYIRTDSTRVSKDAQDEARAYISQKYGAQYVPNKPNVYASKKSAQDAHEAIRPISLIRTPDSLKDILNRNNYRLYKLIYERFLASQMSEATYNSLSVDITAASYGFKVTGKTPLFAGYTAVYSAYTEKKDDDEEDSDRLPDFSEGEILDFIEYSAQQKFTKPPARYTEASLVKTMEEKGIGRPATYVPTITVLFTREYTEHEGKAIKATKLGEDVTDLLIKYFPDIMDVKFTADMENRLDEIEDGGKVWQDVIRNFYGGFERDLEIAQGDSFSLKKPDEKTSIACPECGTLMVLKNGRFGKFLACPSYPKCKCTLPYDEATGKPAESKIEPTGVVCDKCGKPMVTKKGKYGEFLGCSGYPACKNIMDKNGNKPQAASSAAGAESAATAATDENAPPEAVCEKCGKPMVRRKGKFGNFLGCSGYPNCKNIQKIAGAEGKIAAPETVAEEDLPPCPECGKPLKKIKTFRSEFYGCSGYPACKFTSADKPTEEKCPVCGGYTVLKTMKDGTYIKCGDRDCGYKRPSGAANDASNNENAQ